MGCPLGHSGGGGVLGYKDLRDTGQSLRYLGILAALGCPPTGHPWRHSAEFHQTWLSFPECQTPRQTGPS